MKPADDEDTKSPSQIFTEQTQERGFYARLSTKSDKTVSVSFNIHCYNFIFIKNSGSITSKY